jgi:nitrile hydratase
MTPRLSPGDRVQVVPTNPPGHRRTPFYIRGKQGVIERVCGEFPNPEELGHGFDGLPKKQLYRVRFRQKDLWSNYRGSEHDTVDVDVYEHWLIPLPATAVHGETGE